MKIIAEHIGKKFNSKWIFQKVNLRLDDNESLALTGPNGSGKSTLLQIIAGLQVPSLGTVSYKKDNQIIEKEHITKKIILTAPYQTFIEEFTLQEFLNFHFTLRKQSTNISKKEMASHASLHKAWNKPIKLFSSGMKQRLQLLLSFNTNTEVIFLDEPCSYLDKYGIQWYKENIFSLSKKKAIIIASNNPDEYFFCNKKIDLLDFN